MASHAMALAEKEGKLSHGYLLENIDYDAGTGIFRWKANRKYYPNRKGKLAGRINLRGYRQIHIDGFSYRGSRLAWFYVTGVWPKGFVDHKNGVTNDDRFCNLREANDSENQYNRGASSTNTSGHKGIIWHKREKKWWVRVSVDRKRITVGRYVALDDAVAAQKEAIFKYHGEFARAA